MDFNVDKARSHVSKIVGFDSLKKFAVAIILLESEEGGSILFEERAHKMKHQPGDVCFPGGKVEEGETPKEAVIREICEELLVSERQIEVIGESDIYLTGKGGVIYPFVVQLYDYKDTFSEDEVEEVFKVPLSYFRENEPEEVFTTTKEIPDENFPFDRIYGGKEYSWREYKKRIVFYQYGKKTIWGMTGAMIENFARTFL